MTNNIHINSNFKKLLVILPILTGTAISTFLSGKILAMPSDFPYNRGMWAAMGVGIILLTSFIITLFIYVIARKIGRKT